VRRTVALLLAGAVALAGCRGGSDDEPPEPGTSAAPAYRLTADCPKPERIAGLDVGFLNRVVKKADLPAWQAADIGASARLSDGRLVWLFGDTLRDAATYSPDLVGNSMLITSGACAAQVMAADDGPVIPDAREGVVLWPMSVVVLDARHLEAAKGYDEVIVVLCARTRRGMGGNMDFTFLGTSAAVFGIGRDGVPQLGDVMELSPDDEDERQVNWGAASTVHGGWMYVYGTRLTGHDFGRELYVCRAPVAAPNDRKRWQFWDGRRWQSDRLAARAILPGQGGVSQTLSVDVVDGQFVAVSKRDGDLGDFVYEWIAPGPTGPWTPRQGVAAPSGFDTGQLKYAPLAHPEIDLADGNLLVSISRNTTDPAMLLEHPEMGRPVFAEVERP
jgi:hypothetical protein